MYVLHEYDIYCTLCCILIVNHYAINMQLSSRKFLKNGCNSYIAIAFVLAKNLPSYFQVAFLR